MIIFHSKRHYGGYGDRLVGLGACLAMAIVLGHQFKVIWDEDLSEVFEDYQSAMPLPVHDFNYTLRDKNAINCQWKDLDFSQWKDRVVIIATNQPLHHNLWLNPLLNLDRSYAAVTAEAYGLIYSKYLIPKASFKNRAIVGPSFQPSSLISSSLPFPSSTRCIGLQIRCGDLYLTGDRRHDYVNPTQLDNLLTQLKAILPTDLPLYVTSDNTVVYEKCKKYFPQTICHQFENVGHFDHTNSTIQMANTILEHYTLAQCSSIITCEKTSNFGLTAALTGHINHVIFYNKRDALNYFFKVLDHQLYPCLKTTILLMTPVYKMIN